MEREKDKKKKLEMKREIEHFVYLGAFMKNILLEMIIHNSFYKQESHLGIKTNQD